MTAMSH